MKRKWKIMIVIIIGAVILGAVLAGPIMSDVEHPKYKVISDYHEEQIQIREYAPLLIAELSVDGTRQEAISEGFRQLADYIFGNNISKSQIAMTAPVSQKSEKIAMTAPVTQKPQQGQWLISFVMPSEYTQETIAKPVNPNIHLKQIDTHHKIVIRFSGQNTDDNIQEYLGKLKEFMQKNQIQAISEPSYAFYNPPWTLPPLRRNEIMFDIEPISSSDPL